MPLAVQWLNLSNWPDDVINKEIMAYVIIKQRSKKNYFKNILYIFHEQPLNNGCLPPPPPASQRWSRLQEGLRGDWLDYLALFHRMGFTDSEFDKRKYVTDSLRTFGSTFVNIV